MSEPAAAKQMTEAEQGTDTAASRIVLLLFLLLTLSLGTMRPAFDIAGYAVPLTDFIFIAAFAAWALSVVFGKASVRGGRFLVPIAVYTAAMFASAAFSGEPRHSLIKFAGVLYLSLLAFLTFQVVANETALKRVVTAFLIGAAFASVIGVVTVSLFYIDRDNAWHDLFLHHYGSLPPGNYPRIQSTFFYPAMLCNFLTVAVVLLFGAKYKGWIGRRWFSILMALYLFAAAFTVTPGLGGLILGIAVGIGIRLSGRPAKAIVIAGILAAAAFTVVAAFTAFKFPEAPYSFDIAGVPVYPTQRLLAWQDAVQNFAEHPVFGKGTGEPAAEVYFTPPSGEKQIITDAHNSFLNIAAQAGVFGLAAIVYLCVFIVRTAFFTVHTSGFAAWLGIAFMAAFIIQGMVGSFEDARHLWLLIGLIPAAAAIRRPEH